LISKFLFFVSSQSVWSILNEDHNEKLLLSNQIQRTINGEPLTSALMLRDISFDSISFRYPSRPSSIYDNIAYGHLTLGEDLPETVLKSKVIQAADTANARGFIEQLPDKYDTKVGERGTMLSGEKNKSEN
jgi:hypothetical protein